MLKFGDFVRWGFIRVYNCSLTTDFVSIYMGLFACVI